jgi:hypothetical protein
MESLAGLEDGYVYFISESSLMIAERPARAWLFSSEKIARELNFRLNSC